MSNHQNPSKAWLTLEQPLRKVKTCNLMVTNVVMWQSLRLIPLLVLILLVVGWLLILLCVLLLGRFLVQNWRQQCALSRPWSFCIIMTIENNTTIDTITSITMHHQSPLVKFWPPASTLGLPLVEDGGHQLQEGAQSENAQDAQSGQFQNSHFYSLPRLLVRCDFSLRSCFHCHFSLEDDLVSYFHSKKDLLLWGRYCSHYCCSLKSFCSYSPLCLYRHGKTCSDARLDSIAVSIFVVILVDFDK